MQKLEANFSFKEEKKVKADIHDFSPSRNAPIIVEQYTYIKRFFFILIKKMKIKKGSFQRKKGL